MIRSLVAALLCSTLAACDSATGASVPVERFALNVTTPVVLQRNDVRFRILQDTLIVESDGTAERRLRQTVEYDDPAFPDATVETREAFTYVRNGSTIEFTNVCPPNALCGEVRYLWGQVEGDALRLQMVIDPQVPLTYRRVAP